ncbi:hypothetical protein [Vulgatibacter incomptus]|uniref:hypothetical protein n=1 Tax=Vulgatibacter incomptus TaxID=1391653 RepID=UPI00067FD23B|nr:hypothetical protein [Vulgatibacter incomptus]
MVEIFEQLKNSFYVHEHATVTQVTSLLAQEIVAEADRVWDSPAELYEWLRSARTRFSKFETTFWEYFGPYHALRLAEGGTAGGESAYLDSVWRNPFVDAGGRREDLPTISPWRNPEGTFRRGDYQYLAMERWFEHVNSVFDRVEFEVIRTFAGVEILRAIGYAAEGDRFLWNSEYAKAVDSYRQAQLHLANSRPADVEYTGFVLQIRCWACLDRPLKIRYEGTNLGEEMQRVGGYLPFAIAGALREEAMEERSSAESNFAEAVAEINLPRPYSSYLDPARSTTAWTDVATTYLEKGEQLFRAGNVEDSIRALRGVFRASYSRNVGDGMAELPEVRMTSTGIIAVRSRAVSLVHQIRNGITPFGFNSDYLPPGSAESQYLRAMNSLRKAIEVTNLYVEYRKNFHDNQDILTPLGRERTDTLAELEGTLIPAFGAKKDDLERARKELEKAKRELERVRKTAARDYVLDLAGKFYAPLGKWAGGKEYKGWTGLTSALTTTGWIGMVEVVATGFLKFDSSVKKTIEAAEKVVREREAAVRTAQAVLEQAGAAWRKAVARSIQIEDLLRLGGLEDGDMTAAWWLKRSSEMKDLAQRWIDRAVTDVWLYQQAIEKMLDAGVRPLSYDERGRGGECVSNPFSTSWVEDGQNLEYLLGCLERFYGQRRPEFHPNQLEISVRDHVDALAWEAFRQGMTDGKLEMNLDLEELERSFPTGIHMMTRSVRLKVRYSLPLGVTNYRSMPVTLSADPVSYVRIFDPEDNYAPNSPPIVTSEEWLTRPDSRYKIKRKVDGRPIVLGFTDNLEPPGGLQYGIIELKGASLPGESDWNSNSVFSSYGVARRWVISFMPAQLAALGYRIDLIEDVSLVFEGLQYRDMPNEFSLLRAQAIVETGQLQRAVFAMGGMARRPPRMAEYVLTESELGSLAGKRLKRLFVYVVSTEAVAPTIARLTFADGRSAGATLAVLSDGRSLGGVFSEGAGLPNGIPVDGSIRVQLGNTPSFDVSNVLVAIEYGQ